MGRTGDGARGRDRGGRGTGPARCRRPVGAVTCERDAPRVAAPATTRRLGRGIAAVIAISALTGGGSGADFGGNLAATSTAPAARATAHITKTQAGFRVVLDAHGLPKLPAGEYYQAWLKNARGTLVPIGTFSSSDGRVTLWSGVSPKDFNLISVTLEAADGDQDTSGRKVLTGQVHP